MHRTATNMAAAAAVALVLLVLPTGAGWAQDGKPGAAKDGAGRGDPVVAIVDGHEIHMSDVEASRAFLPPEARQYPMSVLYETLVSNLVSTRVLAEEARRQGYHQEAEVKRRIASLSDQILLQALLGRHVDDQLSEKMLRERYDQYIADNPPIEEVRARHILVETEEQAREIIGRVGKGEDFAKLAKEVSTGPSGKVGGDLGYFTRDKMVPEFSAAAFELEAGDVTEAPVKTQFGWHVIKIEDKRTQDPPSFAEAEGQIRQTAEQEITDKYIGELRGKADITTFNPDGSPKAAEPAGK